ncbi:quinone oxidoreductase [Roseomonas terrae]|jgi:NADPH2:quinone reductase|uniref:Quinone oxidoreductase n=1 Tax=Neoroseomonas terrae TaxID=424799 RepID=A0ABS5EEX9_9PROT|nr:quinone oxidoreductase [Neoroseomonas terrae]MBR0649570.1 quinone oxidoreductase [Neoroseomonas terrae]
MPRAIMLREHGGPQVLRAETIEVGAPGAGELLVRQTAIGVNFHDCYVRSGLYRTLPLPGIPGIEGAGVVEAVGAGVTGFAPGDRVGYVTGRYGGYASHRLLPAAVALKLPEGMSEALAASVLLKGLTVDMLIRRVHRVEAGQTILVHAAAGGVGRLLCQWASALGATVIGTVGSAAKAAIAREAGCAHVVLYRDQDFVAEVQRITGGRGVDAAYDSVGRDTFDGSLDCLARCGHLVNFGQASGPVPAFEVQRLAAKSNSVTRPIVFHYLAERPALEAMAASLFDALSSGVLRAQPGASLPMDDAARAHELLESRQADAPLILLP